MGATDLAIKFQTIFDRLERLESRIFASEPEQPPSHPNVATNRENQSDWQLKPCLLQPSYLELIVMMNVSKILEERRTSVRAAGEMYLSLVHDCLPVISRERLERRIQEAENLQPNGAFLIFILSILLLTEEPAVSTISSTMASPPELYRVCKYNYSLFGSLKEPCIELIQSGVLIALYEYAQCIGDQAYLTIGTCARMAGAIGLYQTASNTSPASVISLEEEMNILLGIYILDRWLLLAL
jgi:hypothetical protein